MKRIGAFAITACVLALLSCDRESSDSIEFFKKKNLSTINSHETDSGINDSNAASGEHLYVPVYSSIYFKDSTRVYNLTVTLSIRNTDTAGEIFIKKIDYYNSRGEFVKSFLKKDALVKPMETFDLVVAEDDTTGGIGASFLVNWVSAKSVTLPVVEAVMISTRQGVGLSFISNAKVIKKVK